MRKEYYIIQVQSDEYKKRIKMNAWCDKFIGQEGRFNNGDIENWVVRHCCPVGESEYIFAREEDAVLFALRWK